jgi:hypothetical protein
VTAAISSGPAVLLGDDPGQAELLLLHLLHLLHPANTSLLA